MALRIFLHFWFNQQDQKSYLSRNWIGIWKFSVILLHKVEEAPEYTESNLFRTEPFLLTESLLYWPQQVAVEILLHSFKLLKIKIIKL